MTPTPTDSGALSLASFSTSKASGDIFAKVRDKSNHGMKNQQLAVAMLAAVDEIIKQKSMQLSPTAYFATLMMLLSERSDAEDEEIGAMVYLLTFALPRVPHAILRQKFEETLAVMVEIIQGLGVNASITRHCIACIASLLIAQEAAAWSSSSCNSLFQMLLVKLVDDRPKVRKHAEVAVANILNNAPPPTVQHPASVAFTRFITAALKQSSNADSTENDDKVTSLIGYLSLQWCHIARPQIPAMVQVLLSLRTAKQNVTAEMTKSLFEALSALMIVWRKSGCEFGVATDKLAQVLFAVLDLRPNVNDAQLLPLWLSCAVNGTIALWDTNRPLCHSRLASIYEKLFDLLQFTPHTKTSNMYEQLETSLTTFLYHVVDQDLVRESCVAVGQVSAKDRVKATPLEAIISKTGIGLTLSFQSGWSTVLFTIKHIITALRRCDVDAPFLLTKNVLQVLSDDEVYAQNQHYPHSERLMDLFGAAVRCMRLQQFLSVMPLNIDDSVEGQAAGPQRLWLLPVLQKNLINQELAYFCQTLLPLSHRIAQKGHAAISSGHALEGKTCAVVWRQIWETLPAFCSAPSDVATSLTSVLEIAVSMLTGSDDDERGVSICEALRNLVTKMRECIKENQRPGPCSFVYTISTEEAHSSLAVMADNAHMLFPALFAKFVDLTVAHGASAENAKSKDDKHVQLKTHILDTIRVWISISSQQLINRFFTTTIKKFLETSTTSGESTDEVAAKRLKTHAMMDLINAFLHSMRLEPDAVQLLCRVVSMGVTQSDGTLQKKCYRALCMLHQYCYVDEATLKFDDSAALLQRSMKLREMFWENKSFLLDTMRKVMDPTVVTGAASRKDRIALVLHLVDNLRWDSEMVAESEQLLAFIPMALTETILATKEVNEKARLAAYDLLIHIARRVAEIEQQSGGKAKMGSLFDEDKDDENDSADPYFVSINEVFKMALAGLAGKTPHMISASIHALSRLVFEFAPEKCPQVDASLINSVIQSVLLYAQSSKNREIIKAALGFLKVIVVVMPHIFAPGYAAADGDSMDDGSTANFDYTQAFVSTAVKWSAEHKSHFRVQCRGLIERLVRKAGYDAVARNFPEEHSKLLVNVRKRGERAQRKKDTPSSTSSRSQASYESIVNDEHDEEEREDADNEDEHLPQMLQELVGAVSHGKKGKKFESLRIREVLDDDQDPVDFLDKKTVGRVYDRQIKKPASGNAKPSTYEQDDSGRLIVNDSDDEPTGTGEASAENATDSAYMESIDSKHAFKYSGDGKRIKFSNKRSREAESGVGGDDDAPTSATNGKRKRINVEAERQKAGIKHTGKEYSSKKAKGDVKRAGKPDPYAYIPLNTKLMSASGKGQKKKNIKLNKQLLDI